MNIIKRKVIKPFFAGEMIDIFLNRVKIMDIYLNGGILYVIKLEFR